MKRWTTLMPVTNQLQFNESTQNFLTNECENVFRNLWELVFFKPNGNIPSLSGIFGLFKIL